MTGFRPVNQPGPAGSGEYQTGGGENLAWNDGRSDRTPLTQMQQPSQNPKTIKHQQYLHKDSQKQPRVPQMAQPPVGRPQVFPSGPPGAPTEPVPRQTEPYSESALPNVAMPIPESYRPIRPETDMFAPGPTAFTSGTSGLDIPGSGPDTIRQRPSGFGSHGPPRTGSIGQTLGGASPERHAGSPALDQSWMSDASQRSEKQHSHPMAGLSSLNATPAYERTSRMAGAYPFTPVRPGQDTPRKAGEPGASDLPSVTDMLGSFDFNAVMRGVQVTAVGAYRALQNPDLFKSKHYRHAGLAVLAGLVLRVVVAFPIVLVRLGIWFAGLFLDLQNTIWDDNLVDGLEFIEHSVLQIPFFLVSMMRFLTPTLDQMFMDSLDWVDHTYMRKHEKEDPSTLRPLFAANLRTYPGRGEKALEKSGSVRDGDSPRKNAKYLATAWKIMSRYLYRGLLSVAVYLASFIPFIGPFVLPIVSYLTFRKAVGTGPATAMFACGLVVPKYYVVVFLQTYFSSRSLMRQLLDPYFSRIRFTKTQKAAWFKDRAGVLFGFSLAFYLLIRIPLFGVLAYGIAEASTAYLLTKITDPPPVNPASASMSTSSMAGSMTGWMSHSEKSRPDTSALDTYVESSIHWKNKHHFLSLPLTRLDELSSSSSGDASSATPSAQSTLTHPNQHHLGPDISSPSPTTAHHPISRPFGGQSYPTPPPATGPPATGSLSNLRQTWNAPQTVPGAYYSSPGQAQSPSGSLSPRAAELRRSQVNAIVPGEGGVDAAQIPGPNFS